MTILRFALVLLVAQTGWSQAVLRLKTRIFRPAVVSRPDRTVHPITMGPRHYLVLFGSYPGSEVRAELERRRIHVVAYVPENGLMVSTSRLNLKGLGVSWSGPMDPADKISPALDSQPVGAYLLFLQPDADPVSSRTQLQEQGFTVVENSSLLPGQLLVTGAQSALHALAALDSVAYILPASVELQAGSSLIGCAGALTEVGLAAQYVLSSSSWGRDTAGNVALHYFFDSLTSRLDETLVRSEVARAFAEWTRWANLTITPATQPNQARSIEIQFARWAHGDSYPFDGPGGSLAHTFYPAPANAEPGAGDMHLDADESWRVGSTVDLYSVALHETGHALGLGHSDNPGSVMYPYYRLQTGLTADDIAGVQALYGKNGQSSSTGPPPAGSGTGSGTGGDSGSTGMGTGTKPAADAVSPSLTITTPGVTIFTSYTATVSIAGKASDNLGVTAVKWTTSTGSSGTASGITSWSAVVPLLVGDNVVTVRAYDAAGNSSWRAVTVVRR